MRRNISLIIFVLVAFSAFALALAGGDDDKMKTTITGTLVDLSCYAKAGYMTNDHGGMKNCGTACAKSGQPVAVVDKDKNVHVLAAPAPDYAELVGMEVRVTGTQGKYAKNAFVPEKVEVKKDGKWMVKDMSKSMM